MAPSGQHFGTMDVRNVKWAYQSIFTHDLQLDSGDAMRQDDISVDTRLAVMTAIFFVSFLAVSLPSLSKRMPFLRIPRIIFFACKHFGTGIILSTAFCHLLQDAFHALYNPAVTSRWNIGNRTGLIVLISLLSIFIVEYLSTSYVERLQAHPSAPQSPNISPVSSPPSSPHSPHQLPLPINIHNNSNSSRSSPVSPRLQPSANSSSAIEHAQSYTKPSESTPLLLSRSGRTPNHSRNRSKSFSYGSRPDAEQDCDTLFFEGHHRHERRGRHNTHHSRSKRRPEPDHNNNGQHHDDDHPSNASGTEHSQRNVVPAEVKVGRKRQIVGILILQLGIMIHSFVIGLTLSIVSTEFASLVTAIIFHQLFEGLSLGIRIASLPVPREGESQHFRFLDSTLSLLFAVTTPVGMLVGLVSLSEGTDVGRMKLTQGLMSAMSAGMLIYSTCVEMLAGDFIMDTLLRKSSIWKQALALISLFGGATAMALVGK